MRCRVTEKLCPHCSAVNVQISSRLPSEICSRQSLCTFVSLACSMIDLRVLFPLEHHSPEDQAFTFPRRTSLVQPPPKIGCHLLMLQNFHCNRHHWGTKAVGRQPHQDEVYDFEYKWLQPYQEESSSGFSWGSKRCDSVTLRCS